MSDSMKRNPHPDFKKVEASRPAWDTESRLRYIQTPLPSWAPGGGTNQLAPSSSSSSLSRKHVVIDPDDVDRPSAFNYKLLISAITPRPIAFISSYIADAQDPENCSMNKCNLAPFSYFSIINHDPPLFTVGFASPVGAFKKDTLRNIVASRECVVNIISEEFLEAANVTSVNSPPDVDEWILSGLTKKWDCETTPRCPRVEEAVFSIECKVESIREFESRREPGKVTGTMVVLEGTRFWVREDGINEQHNMVAPEVLRPVSRLGGITYGRTAEVLELPRPDFEKDLGGYEGYKKIKANAKG